MPIKGKLGAVLGIGAVAAASAFLLVVPSWQISAQGQTEPAESAVGAPQDRADTAVVLPVDLTQALVQSETRTRSFAGSVEALRTVDLAFQISGQIVEFPVIAGARVPAGGLIGQIDNADFQLALDRARAAYDLARSEFTRASALSDRGVATGAQLDLVSAQLSQAEVALREAERRLTQTEVRAPFDAIVARTYVEAYANVTTAQPVVRLQDVSELLIRISLPEDLAAVARVQPDLFSVTATFPAAPGYRATLEPRSFAAEANASTRTFDIEFRIAGDIDPRILPGMTANVAVGESESSSPAQAVTLPVSAVDTTSRANPTVWIYNADDSTVTRRDVRLGLPRDNRIVVLEGLEPGETVVATGWWRLRDGARVAVVGL